MIKGKVLLVDDRAEFIAVLEERMRSRGYEAMGASSGAQALEAVAGPSGFDVVVLDMVMPEMDGIETLKRLRRAAPEVAVIVLTGYGSSAQVAQALALGAQDYLVKPVDLDVLLDRIDEAIAAKAPGGDAPA
jgi:CheY-like chemotaxis protein